MNPGEYCARLRSFLETHPFVASFQFSIEQRGETFLFLSGRVEFLQGTTLDFREFLEFRPNRVDRYMYAYNYRRVEHVIFRYDNAPDPRARHLQTFPLHKHVGQDLLPSVEMDLFAAVEEILKDLESESSDPAPSYI